MCASTGTSVPLLNGDFSDDSGSIVGSPHGWTVRRAATGSFYFFGDVGDGAFGFAFGAYFNDNDIVSQAIAVEEGCQYQVLYTLSVINFGANIEDNFQPTIDQSPLLDAEGKSLEESNLSTGSPSDYVGVFTAQASLVTLSFAGRNAFNYYVVGNVQVLAL